METQMTRYDIQQEILEEMLTPGYAPLETGYQMLLDGNILAATYTRFPYAKGKMVEWWFGSFLHNTQSYKLWHPDHTTFVWDDKKKPGICVGATHISEEYLGNQVVPMQISFYDPADIFDISRFEPANIGCALVAEIRHPDGSLFGMFLHIVRDTSFGCEMRNRFWLIGANEEVAKGLIKHNLEEMGSLAEFLPGLYLRENQC
ncbi:DAPG hydrolase family protein [Chloroflexota bacterium]